MTHYIFAEKPKASPSERVERWEAFAAFISCAAFVALAGFTYSSLKHGDVYQEVQKNDQLGHFAQMLDETSTLKRELRNNNSGFTVIAPTDYAFSEKGVELAGDDASKQDAALDKRFMHIGDQVYVMQSKAYVIRHKITEQDVPLGDGLALPSANGDIINLSREQTTGRQTELTVNGVPVKQRIAADNGVIYVVDSLIYPLQDAR